MKGSRIGVLWLAVLTTLAFGAASVTSLVTPEDADAAKLKRHENRYWVWYAPRGWQAAWGRAGIDVTSPTGVLYVGQGWSGTADPVTHRQVFNFAVQSGGLDVHPLRRVKVIRKSRIRRVDDIKRQVIEWKSYRKDRNERVRGKAKIDVFQTYYGFVMTTTVAPKRKWDRKKRLLGKISRLLFYKPQSP